MTVCNMAIEAGTRRPAGVDETTMAYVRTAHRSRPRASTQTGRSGTRLSPTGAPWHSDPAPDSTPSSHRRGSHGPQVTGHVAGDGARRRGPHPDPDREGRQVPRRDRAALEYMGLAPNKADRRHHDRQRCSSARAPTAASRIRSAAAVVRRTGGHIAANVKLALVVPGSGLVKAQAEREGLDVVFRARLRVAGTRLLDVPGDECRPARARRTLRVDSNRNFEGRQGAGGRTPSSARRWPRRPRWSHFVDVRRILT